MKKREIIVTSLITIIAISIYLVNYLYQDKVLDKASNAYKVYLNGETIGLIQDEDALYTLINKEQENIRKTYDVDAVYPPTGFNLVKTNTFNTNYASVNDIYDKIAEVDDFTIEGYIITIKFPESKKKDNLIINVLDKEVFTKAINNFVLSFVSEEEIENYLSGNRSITEIGKIISSMYFNEVITIKKGYISVHDKIFTDAESLSQYLLFGPDAKMDSYEVQLGDDIEKISEKYKINPQEFIIANPKYRDKDALLTVGSKVNVTVLNPMIEFVYDVYEISEKVTPFTKKQVVDSTKDSSYRSVKAGVDGLALSHVEYQVVNGDAGSEVKEVQRIVIREMVEQVTTVGQRYSISGNNVDFGGNWHLPTNYPYYLTSPFGWRSGKMHLGQDISGTGYGSPIYAVDDAVVVEVSRRSSDGNYILLQHTGNIYTQYAHLDSAIVSVGQTVKRGQQIGRMGHSGLASGTHVHFGVSIGWPYHNGEPYQWVNPRNYIAL